MSAHTPGPWDYQVASNYCGYAIAPRGTLPTLAAVERPRGNPETLNVTAFNFPGSTEANARLIAAAPSLLDALQKLLGAASWSAAHSEPFATDSPGIVWARAAIAKATGEQP